MNWEGKIKTTEWINILQVLIRHLSKSIYGQ